MFRQIYGGKFLLISKFLEIIATAILSTLVSCVRVAHLSCEFRVEII